MAEANQFSTHRTLKQDGNATHSAGGSDGYGSKRTLKERQGLRDTFSGQASLSLVGTVIAGGATEEMIVTGGETLVLTLTGDTWHPDIGADNAITDALIASITGPGAEVAGWNAQILAGDGAMDFNDVVRSGDTAVTITLPASASFAIAADEVITAAVPAVCVQKGVAPAGQGFTVTGNVSIALTGTAVAGGVLESEIVSGGANATLIITLSGDTWVATIGDDNDITTDFLAAITGDLADAAGWNAEVALVHGNLTRDSNTQLTLVLPASASYAITSDDETVTVAPPDDSVTGGIIPASKTFVITEGS